MFEGRSVAWTRGVRWFVLLASVVLAAMALPTVAPADEFFQLRYNVERSATGSIRLNGTVMNEGRQDVLDVYVTAEALDAAGKVLGRGVSFVSSSIPQRASSSFVVSIPAAPAATSFRVRVSSYRFGPGFQSG